MQMARGPITNLLNWLIGRFGYDNVIFIKDTIPTFCAVIIGGIISIILMGYVLKDARIVTDPDAEGMHVTQVSKNHRKKIFITIPQSKSSRISLVTFVVLYLNAVIVKFLPIKQIRFVDSSGIKIAFGILVLIIIGFCIFAIVVDFHEILPDHNGEYRIFEFNW